MAKKKKKKVDISDMFDDDLDEHRDMFSTGLPMFDIKLGGGLAEGTSCEASGPPGSGKTSVGYAMIGEMQAREQDDHMVLFDAEGSYNPDMAARCGIDLKHVDSKGEKTFHKSSKAEIKVIEVLFDKIKTILYNMPRVRIIMVDSVAALIPQAMTEKDANLNRMGMLRAKLLADLIPLLNQWIKDTGDKCLVYFVNHEKTDISFAGHGPAKTNTPGGVSLKFLASSRLEFKQVKQDKIELYDPVTKQKTKEVEKLYIRVQATKNRFAPPFRPVTFIFNMGLGIDHVATAVAHGVAQENITVTNASQGRFEIPEAYTTDGKPKKLHGQGKVEDYFRENPEQFDSFHKQVLADFGVKGTTVEVTAENENMLDIDELV